MKTFEIKHRFTGKVIFSLKCKSFKICIETAIQGSANLSSADLRSADLRSANLSSANLRSANLRSADLSYADLRSDDGKTITINKIPLQFMGLQWDTIIFDSHIKIGCEFHSIKQWAEFDDTKIKDMDCNALKFWKQNKDMLLNICETHGRK